MILYTSLLGVMSRESNYIKMRNSYKVRGIDRMTGKDKQRTINKDKGLGREKEIKLYRGGRVKEREGVGERERMKEFIYRMNEKR